MTQITDASDLVVLNPGMSRPRRYPLRIVVQHVHEPESSYRLIAYDDRGSYRPLEFGSREELMSRLRYVVPEIDDSVWPTAENLHETRIVFTADTLVDESRLQLAGLTIRS